MLHYFPTPYPDELWYSVLCRYHVRTGNSGSAATFRELFGNRDNAALSSFMPNGLMKKITDQLPEGCLDLEDLAIHHTLFNYMLRFHSLEDKIRILDGTKEGRSEFNMSGKDAVYQLKVCPLCMREDKEHYGEVYWHVSHQIPSVTVCAKHGCRLNHAISCSKKELNSNLFLPEKNLMETVNFDIKQIEVDFAKVLEKYLKLPFEVGPTEGHSNLYEGLLNAGYGIARKDNHYSVDYKRVAKDLCAKFGKDFVAQYFGDTDLRAAIFGNICHWKYQKPERYAALSLLIRQEPEITFSLKKIENKTNVAFRELARSPILVSKKYAAEKLGVKEMHLDIISHNLGIAPFWEQRPETDFGKKVKYNLYMTEKEWDYICRSVRERGFPSASACIRYCIEQTMEQEKQSW